MNQWIARTRAIRVQCRKKPNQKPYLAKQCNPPPSLGGPRSVAQN